MYGVVLNLFGAVLDGVPVPAPVPVLVPVPDMLLVVWKRNFLLAYGVPLVLPVLAPVLV